MSKLDIKKIYIDSRFKTPNSESDSDFKIEIARQFNIPDGVVCYVDDIVLPVSWTTIGDRNNNLYFSVFYDSITNFHMITMDSKNHSGATFGSELEAKLNSATSALDITFTATYDYTQNIISISFTDDRVAFPDTMTVVYFTDDDISAGDYDNTPIANPKTINRVLGITSRQTSIEGNPLLGYLDLHTTRNLYLISSALASYDTISNFGIDSIIKKIPVRAQYNEILFDQCEAGFDYNNVSRRTLRNIDFRLVDSHFNTVDLRGNHWSFSLVFVES